MSGEIRKADAALSQRKGAVSDGQDRSDGQTLVGPASIALGGPPAAFALIWLDGIAMGLLIAQAREQEAAKARAKEAGGG